MRTSQYQFEMLVTFMEEHGDLFGSRTLTPKEKIKTLTNWEEFCDMLNRDVSGDSKDSTKWKKVWSDFKNNTKKKYSRIQEAIKAGGPPSQAKLSELEHRVLALIGIPENVMITIDDEAEGSENEEETTFEVQHSPKKEPTEEESPVVKEILIDCVRDTIKVRQSPNTEPVELPILKQIFIRDPLKSTVGVRSPRTDNTEEESPPAKKIYFREIPRPIFEIRRLQKTDDMEKETPVKKKHVQDPLKTAYEVRSQPMADHTYPAAPSKRETEPLSDAEWRKFKMQQHQEYLELKREQNRIRELEVRTQMGWQELGARALDILGKFVDRSKNE
ncbi:hypothetical protein ABMA27_008131 [Loxostege sticticalis]|uniref:Regulatory protein zeste n=1 Tax=Loxostege sticticalis TaxID=481309 RepID=A0ABR3HE36_LOXSC